MAAPKLNDDWRIAINFCEGHHELILRGRKINSQKVTSLGLEKKLPRVIDVT